LAISPRVVIGDPDASLAGHRDGLRPGFVIVGEVETAPLVDDTGDRALLVVVKRYLAPGAVDCLGQVASPVIGVGRPEPLAARPLFEPDEFAPLRIIFEVDGSLPAVLMDQAPLRVEAETSAPAAPVTEDRRQAGNLPCAQRFMANRCHFARRTARADG
jgi:hypothetical protein